MTPRTGMARHHEGDAERGWLDLQTGGELLAVSLSEKWLVAAVVREELSQRACLSLRYSISEISESVC